MENLLIKKFYEDIKKKEGGIDEKGDYVDMHYVTMHNVCNGARGTSKTC